MDKKKAVIIGFFAYELAIVACSYRMGYLHCKIDDYYKILESSEKDVSAANALFSVGIHKPIGFKKSFKNLVRAYKELFHYYRYRNAPKNEKVETSTVIDDPLPYVENVNENPTEIKPSEPEKTVELNPKAIRTEYHKMAQKVTGQEKNDNDFPDEDVDVGEFPYQIDGEEFVTGCPNYEKIYLTYYIEDEIFADRNEKIVENIETLLGYCPDTFYDLGASGDSVIYVRNDARLEDYEIMKVNLSYAKEVLGLG